MVEEQLSEQQIHDIAMPILKDALGEFGMQDVEVRFDTGYDGAPIVWLTATYGPDASEPDPRKSTMAAVAVLQAVYRAGDDRMVYLLHELPGDAEGLPDY